jgi:hypothetical protein
MTAMPHPGRAAASALIALVWAQVSWAGPVAIESDCEQTKLRRVNDKIDGSNSDRELERARPTPVSVLAALPSSRAAHAAIWGGTAAFTAELARGFATAIDRLRALDRKAIDVELGAADRRAFDQLLVRATGRVVVIVGHAVDGRVRFLRGGELGVLDMAAGCAAHGAFCVFLICETDRLSPGSPCAADASCLPAADQTSAALEGVAARAAAAPSISAKQVQDAIRAAARDHHRMLQAKHLLADGIVVGVLDTIYELPDPGPRR